MDASAAGVAVPTLAELATRACVQADTVEAARQAEAAAKRLDSARAELRGTREAIAAAQAAHEAELAELRRRQAAELLPLELAEREAAFLVDTYAARAREATRVQQLGERMAWVKYVARPNEAQAAALNSFAEALRAMGRKELSLSSGERGQALGDNPLPVVARLLRPLPCPLCERPLGVGYHVEGSCWGRARRKRLGLVCTTDGCVACSTVFHLANRFRIRLCASDERAYRQTPGEVWATPEPFHWVRYRRHAAAAMHIGAAEEESPSALCPNVFVVEFPKGTTPDVSNDEANLFVCMPCYEKVRESTRWKSLIACSDQTCSTRPSLAHDIKECQADGAQIIECHRKCGSLICDECALDVAVAESWGEHGLHGDDEEEVQLYCEPCARQLMEEGDIGF